MANLILIFGIIDSISFFIYLDKVEINWTKGVPNNHSTDKLSSAPPSKIYVVYSLNGRLKLCHEIN